jgi:hypothetical protein
MNAPKSPLGERPEENRLLGHDLPPNATRTVVPGPWGTRPGTPSTAARPAPGAATTAPVTRPITPAGPAAFEGTAPRRAVAPARPVTVRWPPSPGTPVASITAVTPVTPLPRRPVRVPRPGPAGRVTPAGGWPAPGSPASPPASPLPWPGPFPEPAASGAPAGRGPARRHVVGYPVAIVAGIALGLALGGLTTSPSGPSTPGTTPGTTSGEAPATGSKAPGEAPADGPASGRDETHGFGETVTFPDGSTLTAGPPVEFTPDDVALGGDRYERHVKFKVTYVNRGDEEFDPGRSAGSVSSDGTEGEPVDETALQAPPEKVEPGDRATWWLGYGVADEQRATLTVDTGPLGAAGVTFTNEHTNE